MSWARVVLALSVIMTVACTSVSNEATAPASSASSQVQATTAQMIEDAPPAPPLVTEAQPFAPLPFVDTSPPEGAVPGVLELESMGPAPVVTSWQDELVDSRSEALVTLSDDRMTVDVRAGDGTVLGTVDFDESVWVRPLDEPGRVLVWSDNYERRWILNTRTGATVGFADSLTSGSRPSSPNASGLGYQSRSDGPGALLVQPIEMKVYAVATLPGTYPAASPDRRHVVAQYQFEDGFGLSLVDVARDEVSLYYEPEPGWLLYDLDHAFTADSRSMIVSMFRPRDAGGLQFATVVIDVESMTIAATAADGPRFARWMSTDSWLAKFDDAWGIYTVVGGEIVQQRELGKIDGEPLRSPTNGDWIPFRDGDQSGTLFNQATGEKRPIEWNFLSSWDATGLVSPLVTHDAVWIGAVTGTGRLPIARIDTVTGDFVDFSGLDLGLHEDGIAGDRPNETGPRGELHMPYSTLGVGQMVWRLNPDGTADELFEGSFLSWSSDGDQYVQRTPDGISIHDGEGNLVTDLPQTRRAFWVGAD